MFDLSGVSENDSEKCPVNLANEIQMFRREIRKSSWLLIEADTLKSFDGNPYHSDLLPLFSKAKSNYKAYLRLGNSLSFEKIFVTPANESIYNDSSNWTFEKLTQETQLLIEK